MIRTYIKDADQTVLSEQNLSLVPDYRREKVDRLYQEGDKRLSLAAGLLLRQVFGEKNVSISDYKKPFIEGEREFNLAHSGHYAILSVDGESPVGCDIERMRTLDPLRVGSLVFCENELNTIRRARDKCDVFFTLWTKKEAFIKCLGEGFHFNSKQIDLSSPENHVDYNGKTYFFKEYMLGDYKIMICSPHNSFAESIEFVN